MSTRSRAVLLAGAAAIVLAGCGGDPAAEYGFVGNATACERQEWTEERHELLEAGDTADARRFASSRCFRVEPRRRVRIVDREGGMPWQLGRWLEVETVDATALEHLASAELRRATGLPVRTSGWVRGEDLQPVE